MHASRFAAGIDAGRTLWHAVAPADELDATPRPPAVFRIRAAAALRGWRIPFPTVSASFVQAFIYLLAAVVAVPLAKRLGLGSVLGYLLAGMAIGPFALGLVGAGDGDVMHFAEFGVVMMLFLVGLELRPARLWEMRGPILGMGGLQLAATAVLICGVAVACGLPWRDGISIGLILAMSSTAIALQSLGEKGQLKTPGGQSAFSVLLFQDIAVIPILAVLPLLATRQGAGTGDAHGGPVFSLPAWQQALLIIAAVAAVVLAGRFLLRPFFRYIAATRLREMFTATALLLVIGIALLMTRVGLSPALGTFLAGVVLAESEYRHQLETDIEPFKGLLLGLFFISVGASIDFAMMARQPLLVAGLVAALLGLKFAVLYALGRWFRLETGQSLLFAAALAQGGEFGFVLFSFASQHGAVAPEIASLLVAVVALSMACAPLILSLNDRILRPRIGMRRAEREADVIDEHDNPVILAGFGRFGHVVGRLLRANGFATTVLDHDPDQVEALRRFGLKSFYGDASRLDLLHTAGAERAKLFILAIDDEVRSLEIVRTVREHFPRLQILARAVSRQHAYELLRLGIGEVRRETFGSALDLGMDALRALGVRDGEAARAACIFRELDEASVRELAGLLGDDEAYTSRARQHIENLERLLAADRRRGALGRDHAAPGSGSAQGPA
jgi:monovalent cation:proton antiporter-2 (CPA2) family protein